MGMRYHYPARLVRDGGSYVITFPDVPEAITQADAGEDRDAVAADCLATALSFYVDDRRDLPRPSPPKRGQRLIAVGPVIAAKLALYQAMREAGITKVALAARLGVSEAAVRKLLDLDHASKIDNVAAALALLGKRVVVEVTEAA